MNRADDLARTLADRLGLQKHPRSWGGNCPSCDYHGAFSLKVSRKFSRPTLYCANGCTREQLSDVAERVLGTDWTPPPAADEQDVEKARAAKAAAAQRLWDGSTSCANTPAEAYLARRGLAHLAASPELRYRGDCWHQDRSRYPALIARVQDVHGTAAAIHRTYLTREGAKAGVAPPKASLGPVWGSAIRLGEPDHHLVVGEGIETAESAGLLMNLPAWAALSAGNMAAGLILPASVTTVTVAADHDGPGLRAAQDAARRWRAEGRTVEIAKPDEAGRDFNDLLLAQADA